MYFRKLLGLTEISVKPALNDICDKNTESNDGCSTEPTEN